MSLANAHPSPRYVTLAREIADEIARGVHPEGARLRTEIELSAERGVSRATVRAALRRLEELGLVSRRRRSGTHVTAGAPRRQRSYAQSLAGIDDLLQYAAETERRIIGVEPIVADDSLAARLSVRPGSRWLHVSGLRVPPGGSGLPLCWTDSYADAEAAPRDLERRLQDGSFRGLIATLLAERVGRPIEEVTQEIRAAGIPEGAVAQALQAEPGGHALEITRRYIDPSGAPLAVTISLHPAERFSYTTRLRRMRAAETPSTEG
ncbi:DNA-binding transcriptional regulator, GntR family [Roseomonas rosea]|uniref:DNA-binding transcriptional regulator, GntR family n=1 Tax=Muricoccus roseus TaxID=198092 RepID=A0A1M6MZW6_9PROT|nr:GntR family transcriptional regulator [Roseomonas rosea]SHJ88991.1 DNA-binding transcriptional regulator, GntR family [Roseomonas rosea]